MSDASNELDLHFMRLAIAEARAAEADGEVPVGAVVVTPAGEVIATGNNRVLRDHDPTAHAEVVALRAAGQALSNYRILADRDGKQSGCTLYVTLEPCAMCAGAILNARIPTVVFGAWDEKAGAAGSVNDLLRDRRLPHRVEVVAGVEAEACAGLLLTFFEQRR